MATSHTPLHGFPLETVLVFVILSLGAIIIDLYAHRKDSVMSLKSASLWSIFWILISLLFGFYLWVHHDATTAKLFFAGYALEKALSVDNLFVIMAIFSWFKVPEKYRHRVLYWGIIGAIVFRMIFVAIGTSLMALGAYVELLFALIIAWTGLMMLKNNKESQEIEDYSNHFAYRLVYRIFPVWPKMHQESFFLNKKELQEIKTAHPEHSLFKVKKKMIFPYVATPLFLCLAVIELTDVMFAFDSVPAIIAISREPLIVYSAMMFAILGLRTMYFVLEALKNYLVHLEKAVIALLFFIAIKLALAASLHLFGIGYDISPNASLIVVLATLSLGVLASFIFPKSKE